MTKASEVTIIEVQNVINKLRSKHKQWESHQAQSTTMLYTLLENCLEFYRTLHNDEDCVAAFKEVLNFKWNKKTRLSTMIIKTVFGDKAKKGYAYTKALEAAIAQDIGTANTVSMSHWLNDNGGIDGVIRTPNQPSKAALERDHAISVGKNYKDYGFSPKQKPFVSAELSFFSSKAPLYVVLCEYNSVTNETELLWVSEETKLIEEMYALKGSGFMKTIAYKNNRVKVYNQSEKRKIIAREKVNAGLNNIVTSSNPDAQAA